MSNKEKQQLITEVVALLQARLTMMEQSQVEPTQQKPQVTQAPEMLTIKECAEQVKGLSEHTVRQLVKQGKLPSLRTGAGQKGKILVSKSTLLNYFNGGVYENIVA